MHNETKLGTMTKNYRLMIYFGVATLHFYRKDIVQAKDGETLGDFATNNDPVIKRVFAEAKSLFGYELSHWQIGKIVEAYTAQAQSVTNTEVAALRT